MKCAGMRSPFASLMKPESIGCWISACTSVVAPLLVARTRMVDAMGLASIYILRMILSENRYHFALTRPFGSGSCALTAAATDGDLDFLGSAVELATGFDDRNHIACL